MNVGWLEEPVNGVNLIADSTVYQADDLATVRWEIDDGWAPETGAVLIPPKAPIGF